MAAAVSRCSRYVFRPTMAATGREYTTDSQCRTSSLEYRRGCAGLVLGRHQRRSTVGCVDVPDARGRQRDRRRPCGVGRRRGLPVRRKFRGTWSTCFDKGIGVLPARQSLSDPVIEDARGMARPAGEHGPIADFRFAATPYPQPPVGAPRQSRRHKADHPGRRALSAACKGVNSG
jgi:hypothetical protein